MAERTPNHQVNSNPWLVTEEDETSDAVVAAGPVEAQEPETDAARTASSTIGQAICQGGIVDVFQLLSQPAKED